MDDVVFTFNALKIVKRGDHLFAHYDAGAHQVEMREDEITKDEAEVAMQGEDGVRKMLLGLQRRLIGAGVNPYLANTPKQAG